MNNVSVPQNLELSSVPVGAWPANSFQVISLLDMLPFLADLFFFAAHHLDSFECEIKRASDRRGKDSPMTAEEVARARERLKILESRSQSINLDSVLKQLEDIEVEFIQYDFMPEQYPVPLDEIAHQLKHLRKCLARDLGARVFMTLDAADVQYYERDQLFGAKVFDNFYTTRDDVREAGNCYATGRYTACAFHCARVAEKGLHALARDINNKFGAVITFGNKELERVNWGTLIEKIELELDKLTDTHHQPKLSPDDVVFYSRAAKEFTYLKNGWRDDLAHSRVFYDKPDDARIFMNHVKEFMGHLAEQGLTE
jgi:hypothetical protein